MAANEVACACLNVRVRLAASTLAARQEAAPLLGFHGAVAAGHAAGAVVVALPALTKNRDLDQSQWRVLRCLLCDTDVVIVSSAVSVALAGASDDCGSRVFVAETLLDGEGIATAISAPDFSAALGVVMRSPPPPPPAVRSDAHEHGRGEKSLAAQQIQSTYNSYIRRLHEEMSERIKDFIDQQNEQFEAARKQARSDRDRLLRDVEYKGMADVDRLVRAVAPLSVSGPKRHGSGGDDSATDSAVPLSPASLASAGEPSPKLPLSCGYTSQAVARSKPPQVTSASTRLPQQRGRFANSREDDSLFSLDEDHAPPSAYLPADDEADETDDSGTGDDYSHYYPMPPIKGSGGQTAATGAGLLVSKFGTSLPVTIPGRFWPPKDAIDSLPESSSEDDDADTILPKAATNVHEGMRALARSIQAADDPERLFGERPRRRRYCTGDAVRHGLRPGKNAASHV